MVTRPPLKSTENDWPVVLKVTIFEVPDLTGVRPLKRGTYSHATHKEQSENTGKDERFHREQQPIM